ncbi:hypothetical protein BX596_3637 [Enterobacteriaceae bacterium JKS000233]|nr:hypothetical protein BX596_3637 [Enterobacteriaceae bacterium JKS000233]
MAAIKKVTLDNDGLAKSSGLMTIITLILKAGFLQARLTSIFLRE